MAVDPRRLQIEDDIEDCIARLYALQAIPRDAAAALPQQGLLKRRLFNLCATLGRLDRQSPATGQGRPLDQQPGRQSGQHRDPRR